MNRDSRLYIHKRDERPDYEPQLAAVRARAWPRFMLSSESPSREGSRLSKKFTDFLVVLSTEHDEVVGYAHSVPIVWDGDTSSLPEGWDAAIERAANEPDNGASPNTLVALAVVVDPKWQGLGVSARLLAELGAIAARKEYHALIAPVRPSRRADNMDVPFERYVESRRADGLPCDPWLRKHIQVGGRILRIAPRSMVLEASIAEWQLWTGLEFPQSGPYIIPGGAAPLEVSLELGRAKYVEPNVWVQHTPSVLASYPHNRD